LWESGPFAAGNAASFLAVFVGLSFVFGGLGRPQMPAFGVVSVRLARRLLLFVVAATTAAAAATVLFLFLALLAFIIVVFVMFVVMMVC
jgi:hypothetical protein